MNVVVIGGGASGLVSAIFAAKNGNNVTILERNNVCGKKILLTGNGKCNYWNSDQDLSHYHSSSTLDLSKIINKENEDKILEFFSSIGIVSKIKDGYYYPMSNQAISIETALVLEAKLLNIKIKNNVLVNKIDKKEKYVIETNEGIVIADKIILAVGSKSYPKTGSDGCGYFFASSFNHTIIKPLPALVQLISEGKFLSSWAGIRQEVILKLYENENLIKEESGEVTLTDTGISGICAMQLSGFIARGLDLKRKEKLIINFLPWIGNTNNFIEWMDKRNKLVKNRTISELLDGFINYKLGNVMLKLSNINLNEKWDCINYNLKTLLAQNLINFNLDIVSTNSFSNAQVCSGGVSMKEINFDTMESLKCKDLYIVGELLDVNGDCGGYNLGFAWLSGMIAGSAIKKGE